MNIAPQFFCSPSAATPWKHAYTYSRTVYYINSNGPHLKVPAILVYSTQKCLYKCPLLFGMRLIKLRFQVFYLRNGNKLCARAFAIPILLGLLLMQIRKQIGKLPNIPLWSYNTHTHTCQPHSSVVLIGTPLPFCTSSLTDIRKTLRPFLLFGSEIMHFLVQGWGTHRRNELEKFLRKYKVKKEMRYLLGALISSTKYTNVKKNT